MRRPLGLLVVAAILASPIQGQRLPIVRPKAGMVITKSVKLAPGSYLLTPSSGDSAAIVIRGDGIRVDLSGVTLRGTPDSIDPDERAGLAILVDGGHNVSISGGRIRGYQTGIRAVGTTDLALDSIDLSDNWRPRLFSEMGHESLIDWLSFHHNENGEWRRFGAGIALEGVHRGHISGSTVRRGMNGLMLTRSDSLTIDHNDFSFNSGLGIGLYRSTDNVIARNRADYNVRGFSRYYRRGQDSADLLMFEQSSRNTVAFNSMTHGGDGLFLWAGQSTMDTGEGGSNDNHFIANDFSYAPTNGMEATFSRNDFIANRSVGSDHGLWGGYSFDSRIAANCFGENRIGIAVEHGQNITVDGNSFVRDSTALFAWADTLAPSDWGYPKHRDTRSRGWRLTNNHFSGHRVAFRIRQTAGFTEDDSDFVINTDTVAVMRDTSGIRLNPMNHLALIGDPPPAPCHSVPRPAGRWDGVIPTIDSQVTPTDAVAHLPRAAIIIDDWGPYDWATPKLWPTDSTPNAPLQVLGPSGSWRVKAHPGIVTLSRDHGRSGDTIVVIPAAGREGDWRLDLADSAGRPFSFTHFEPIRGWDVQYFAAPGGVVDWNGQPLLSQHEDRLDKMWYRPPTPAIPADHWGLTASSEVDLGPGTYTLRAISDDAIRVWVDGQVVIDHWTPHESLVDAVPIGPGHHGLSVQYRQVDGWVECRVEIVRGHIMSTGSPGPH